LVLTEPIFLYRLKMNQADTNPVLHLVLLPGLDGTGNLFSPFLKQFSDQSCATVIPYPLDHYIPFEHLADYIISLLPKNKPIIILGESYSGPVALSLASRKDIDIQAVILVATFAKYPPSFLKTISKWLPLSLFLQLPIPDFVIRRFCFGSATNKTLSLMLRNAVKANTPNVLAKRARDGASIDVTKLLNEIKIPCLYIAATDDKMVPNKAIDILKRNLSNLEVVTIEGSHFILQVQPEGCYKVINKFLCSIND